MKTVSFTTSQFVTIEYELASPVYRAVASFLDVIFLCIYFMIAGYFINMNLFDLDSNSMQNRLSVMTIFLVRLPWFLYSPIIEYLTNGRSLGKLIMGIRVVKSSGETAGFREYFTRWIFRVVDIWVGGFGFLALLVSGTTEKRQRIGDIMADTVVIKVKDTQMYGLKDVLSIKNSDNHVPTYPNAIRFTDEDMLLIKNTILRVQRFPNQVNKDFAIELAHETAHLMGLPETPPKKMEFLKTVLQDYVVLTR
ncbi:RDD family protein [Fluviicola taffensis]|uniref:RDD domain containing protein n=1 Tax=Fluviicola taffensis (strain DSM 16823 / NCIMB 13979 / RW262) TaxID=755732 RepID=F2IEF4_FLUTR|nr:RDD family protein [Fluviicola taffensis]AEA43478.1 RDD domain containing protein [Fluviicola taffensis DSM 16823]